ncbi:P-loop containing nucleoside triphosphate hydrolase protein [Ascobolus immersus RN42]|uniref:P-loop containing nucleoside triphosphate hydrolase protein n=1 Tax=Ascobolus immersus RN42 TaxID=1160509 RepID=A0A3N4IBK4_ASCIM|nr:P-loop containing nucleoside triphosphate hydrolase protein [Ascobolus immersus RN42]
MAPPDNATLHLVVSSISLGTALIPLILTLPDLYRKLVTRKQKYAELGQLYRDEDGEATRESQAAFSNTIQKRTLHLLSLTGLAVSIPLAVNGTVAHKNQDISTLEFLSRWLNVGTLALINILSLNTLIERLCTRVYTLALYQALPLLVLLVGTLWQLWDKIAQTPIAANQTLGLLAGQSAILLTSILTAVSIPRRPKVYKNGAEVDAMFTTSFASRYTFGWANELLNLSMTKGTQLEDEDIPVLDFLRRAATLQEKYQKLNPDRRLWLQVIVAHWPMFVLNNLFTIGETFLAYSPQFVMFKILQNLERKYAGIDVGYEPYIWVLAMGLIRFVEAIIQSQAFWVCFYGLNFPIRSQLASVIFTKTLSKKDVKGGGKKKEDGPATRPGSANGPINGTSNGTSNGASNGAVNGTAKPAKPTDVAKESEADEDALKNMKQGTINLISIDTERIADAAAFSNLLMESVLGSSLGLIFIVKILSLKALLVGLASIIVIIPANVFFAKKYTRAQDKLMKVRDKKLGVMSEALTGIRQIKFSALERQWEKKIGELRDEELSSLRTAFIYDTWLMACWICNPVFFSVAALSAHAYFEGALTPSAAFTALAVFNTLEFSMSILPEYISNIIDALVSAKRIEDYFKSEDKRNDIQDGETIGFKQADIRWPADLDEGKAPEETAFVLKNVDLEFPQGKLSLITGKTGSGKSLLLSALLGEADILAGTATVPAAPKREERPDHLASPANWIIQNAIAYVAQIPWIENATIKDNILFGLPYDADRYKKTIFACALEKDLEMFPDGELTEIGANGINLSGGQKWRVSFARAMYSRAGILVLDDVFSAVDAHVGAHMFKHALNGPLAEGRTRILVTHHVDMCKNVAAYLVVLEEGKVQAAAPIDRLIEENQLSAILKHDPQQVDTKDDDLEGKIGDDSGAAKSSPPKPATFTEKEHRETGTVGKDVYAAYFAASGGWAPWMWIVVVFLVSQGFTMMRSYWVKMWTSDHETDEGKLGQQFHGYQMGSYTMQQVIGGPNNGTGKQSHTVVYWIGIYCAFSLGTIIVGIYKYWCLFAISLKASDNLFKQLTSVVLRAPSRWLDTVPKGRILNRFTKDFEKIDARLSYDFAFLLYNVLGLAGVFLATAIVSPLMLILGFLMTLACLKFARVYLNGARELKRMESNYRSPIFEHFDATLTGITTIRSFGKSQEYLEAMYKRIDQYTKASYYQWLFNRWVGIRMQFLGGFFAMFVGAAVIAIPNFDPATAGFALSFSITYAMNIIWCIRRYANTELNMNSTERVMEYVGNPIEASPENPAPEGWPSQGHLEVKDLTVSYDPTLPAVLKNISFTANPGERVAVVGRTGAGKSSFSLALFRFIIASSGYIKIDGIDISTISLHDLRSRISIIPQDPVLFSGTVRSNLDPFDNFTDEKLVEALRRVHLIPQTADSGTATPATVGSTAQNPFTDLNSTISEGGLNLSQGQRQLLCLARACVLQPKILLLDEATSSIDMETEENIRESLKTSFAGTTTIIIAHRLEGVMDADKVVVMGSGEVLEVGSPDELMGKADSVFRGMVLAGKGNKGGEGKLIDFDEGEGSGSNE